MTFNQYIKNDCVIVCDQDLQQIRIKMLEILNDKSANFIVINSHDEKFLGNADLRRFRIQKIVRAPTPKKTKPYFRRGRWD